MLTPHQPHGRLSQSQPSTEKGSTHLRDTKFHDIATMANLSSQVAADDTPHTQCRHSATHRSAQMECCSRCCQIATTSITNSTKIQLPTHTHTPKETQRAQAPQRQARRPKEHKKHKSTEKQTKVSSTHDEVQSPHVTTEPSSFPHQPITKYRIPTSQRSHLPCLVNPSQSTESPRHDGAIFLPSSTHHKVQNPDVTTEPSSFLRRTHHDVEKPTSRRYTLH